MNPNPTAVAPLSTVGAIAAFLKSPSLASEAGVAELSTPPAMAELVAFTRSLTSAERTAYGEQAAKALGRELKADEPPAEVAQAA